jgi:flagellar biosynthesis protein FlhB
VAEQADRDQKTESPTPKRRTEAIRNGDSLQSRDLGAALVLAAGAGWLIIFGSQFASGCVALLTQGLSFRKEALLQFEAASPLLLLLSNVAIPLLSLFGFTLLGSIAGPIILGSAGFRSSAILFKASRINPFAGLKRIFGMQGWVELGKSLLKALLLGLCGFWTVNEGLRTLFDAKQTAFSLPIISLGTQIRDLFLILTVGMAVIACIDVPIQIFVRNARLRMTKHEIKEEMRQSEGSPELKQAVRQRQAALLSGSARKAVTEATLILTNPTHFAVALRYVPGRDFAPMVVARGRGETALAIKVMAQEARVPILEYPKLTRALYFTARAGQPISEDLYVAVATILAFVLNLDRSMAERKTRPDVSVPVDKDFDETGRRIFL